MASTLAPDYANLYVGIFEHSYVFNTNRNQKLKWISKMISFAFSKGLLMS